MAEKIAYQAIYARLKRMLGDIKNTSASKIYADTSLGGDGLGFTAQGRRALARHVNKAFSDYGLKLKRTQTGKAKNVRDLAVLVYGAING